MGDQARSNTSEGREQGTHPTHIHTPHHTHKHTHERAPGNRAKRRHDDSAEGVPAPVARLAHRVALAFPVHKLVLVFDAPGVVDVKSRQDAVAVNATA